MNLGQARLTNDHIKYVHIVDLEQYEHILSNIRETFLQIKNPDVQTLKNTTLEKFKILETKLQTLYPKSRLKRGWINGLGSSIKIITGNMDATDADQLNRAIETIEHNEQNIKSQSDRQIIINGKMIERFENITNYINQQQFTINNAINNQDQILTNAINREESEIQLIQYLHQINYNIELLTSHLKDIGESVILAKLNIISNFILNPNEIDYIHQLFQNMSFPIQNTEHIYEILNLQAYYSDMKIIFNIMIPVISKDIYQFSHLVQIPLNKKETISINYPFLAHNNRIISYFAEKCRNVERTFICGKPMFQEPTNTSQCIGKIIQGEDANCQHTEMSVSEKITRPEDNFILITNSEPKILINTCRIQNARIQGTVLIHFENCSVTINNITYVDSNRMYWDEIHVMPIMFKRINKTGMITKLTLRKLEDYHFNNRDQIELLEVRMKNQQLIFYIYATLITLSLIILYFLKTKIWTNYRINNQDPVLQNNMAMVPPITENSNCQNQSNMAPTIDPTLRINWMSPK